MKLLDFKGKRLDTTLKEEKEMKKPKGIKKANKIMGKIVRFFLKFFLILFVILLVLGCIVGGYFFNKVWPYVEEYKELAETKFEQIDSNTFTHLYDTVILDNEDNVIAEININNYQYVKIDNVSKWVSKGYISVEDKRFKVHNGIDYKALLRAGVSLVKNKGKITQGGSTITQQVIKNGLLTQERTFKRKLIEFFLAPEFEKKYTKQEIMEFYVNMNFYGNNCYGIETASQYYFGKPSSDLTLAESAMLVGISNNGSLYNPRKNYDAVIKRQHFVLSEMLEEGCISESEYNDALNEDIEFAYNREQRKKENYQTSYAIHCAILALMEEEDFEFKYIFDTKQEYDEYRKKFSEVYGEWGSKIREGGYIIHTSLDSKKQESLQAILDESLSKYTEVSEDGRFTFQGASVLVNNETGYVEAIIGGRGTEDEYNRGFLAKRQPGSSIKPIVVYTPAFDTGLYYPSLIMNDKDDPDDIYYPKNYGGSFSGRMSIREAIVRSINTIAYQVIKDIEPNNSLKYLEKMKFNTLSYEDKNNTAIGLGGFTFGVRVVDMAKAYSTLINQGKFIDNTCIKEIEYQNEGIIFKEDSKSVFVYEPDAAYMTVDCCKDVLEVGYSSSRGRKVKNQIAMAKSGTTNDSKDIWFCGGTEYYSLAVWVGYDMPKSTGLTGSTLSGQIWKEMMDEVHKDLEKVEFERPETVVDLDIDYQGKVSKYKTGVTGLFSHTLIDRAEKELERLAEEKKIRLDNEFIKSLEERIKKFENSVIEDEKSLNAFNREYETLLRLVSEVYQEQEKDRLSKKLETVYSSFERTIEIVEVKILEDLEKDIKKRIEDFKSYSITDVYDIEYVNNEYDNILMDINRLKGETKTTLLRELKGVKEDKDKLLEPFIEIENRRLEEKEQFIENIEENLNSLRELTEYYEGVETQFNSFEDLLKEGEERGIDTSEYYMELEQLRLNMESLKNVSHPNLGIPID